MKEKNNIFGLWENTYHTIFIYGKMLIIEFSYNFLYVWNCMKLYDKKFLIYGNCMIRSFGQPGHLAQRLIGYGAVSRQLHIRTRHYVKNTLLANQNRDEKKIVHETNDKCFFLRTVCFLILFRIR